MKSMLAPQTHSNVLHPGEKLDVSFNINELSFVEPLKVGEIYSFRFNGGEIEWWNWGRKKVGLKWIPSNESRVDAEQDQKNLILPINSKNHELRPKIVLPSSNGLEFQVVN
jgi:hypothetical protein